MQIDVNETNVSQADVNEYRERGYWITPQLIEPGDVVKLRNAFDRIFHKDYDYDVFPADRVYSYDFEKPDLMKVNNGWWLNEEVRSVVLSSKLGKMISDLSGEAEIRIWHDQVVSKPGLAAFGLETDSANIGWHQDYAHWQVSDNQNMCTLWIALQDTDLSNGGMRTIVGSHKWGLVPDAETFHDKNLDGLREKYGKDREWIDEPCVLRAGQGSVHHCLTFHGSGPNKSDAPRMGMIIHYMPGGTAYRGRVHDPIKVPSGRKGNRHMNVPLLGPYTKPGDKFEGECFPLVWPND